MKFNLNHLDQCSSTGFRRTLGSAKHVVGFRESFSLFRGNYFFLSMLMRHYEIF